MRELAARVPIVHGGLGAKGCAAPACADKMSGSTALLITAIAMILSLSAADPFFTYAEGNVPFIHISFSRGICIYIDK